MFAMPLVIAQQLVADRRASYEAVAFRRQFRHFVSRPAAPEPPTDTPFRRRELRAIAARHDESTATTPVDKVA